MTRQRWTACCALAGEWLLLHDRRPLDRFASGAQGGVGVYIVEALDGTIDYVGSVFRPTRANGIARRIAAHHRAGGRARRWAIVHILQLRETTPAGVVRAIEGLIGGMLLPTSNLRLPAVRMVVPDGAPL